MGEKNMIFNINKGNTMIKFSICLVLPIKKLSSNGQEFMQKQYPNFLCTVGREALHVLTSQDPQSRMAKS